MAIVEKVIVPFTADVSQMGNTAPEKVIKGYGWNIITLYNLLHTAHIDSVKYFV